MTLKGLHNSVQSRGGDWNNNVSEALLSWYISDIGQECGGPAGG